MLVQSRTDLENREPAQPSARADRFVPVVPGPGRVKPQTECRSSFSAVVDPLAALSSSARITREHSCHPRDELNGRLLDFRAMTSNRRLVIRAGPTAARRLREEGFHPDLFGTLVGASGGPKWLVLRALDDFWAERLLPARSRPLDALGSSIGSFRHACLGQSRPLPALERFAESYVEQSYEDARPDPDVVTGESLRILDWMLGEKGAAEVAENEMFRSHIIASRLRSTSTSTSTPTSTSTSTPTPTPTSTSSVDRGLAFQLRLGLAAGANFVTRRFLAGFFERGVFGPAQSAIRYSDFSTRYHALDADSLPLALSASGSIPAVMAGVPRVGDAPGMWFDGGIIDYHFDFSFERAPGLVLFPHFFDRIIPGWFDKPLEWRRPALSNLDDVVMLAPSPEFVAALPGAHVPDRGDFVSMTNAERIRQWRGVLDHCRALVDDWCDLVDGGGLADAVRPFWD